MNNKDITPYNNNNNNNNNNNGKKHVYWERYIGNTLWYKTFFHNNKLSGYEEYYYTPEKLIKTFYIK
jgi:hypothetical protein